MHVESLEKMVQEIVEQARALKDKHTDQQNAPVNYACIFSQSKEEYDDLIETALKIGKVVEEMKTGLLFQVKPLDTIAGKLQLLKIRIPDVTRPERGDADFTVSNYPEFKKKYLSKKGFSLIKKREDFEMLELMNPEFKVRVYFSDPPLDKQFGLT